MVVIYMYVVKSNITVITHALQYTMTFLSFWQTFPLPVLVSKATATPCHHLSLANEW